MVWYTWVRLGTPECVTAEPAALDGGMMAHATHRRDQEGGRGIPAPASARPSFCCSGHLSWQMKDPSI